MRMPVDRTQGDALDRLEYENKAVRELLRAFADDDLDRSKHGEVIKLFTEHLAIREAAREYVVESIGAVPELRDVSERWKDGTSERRRRLARLEESTRGVEAINVTRARTWTA